MRFLILLFFLCSLVWSQESYSFGVFPHLPLKKLHEKYKPVAKYFEKHTSKEMKLMTKPYYKLFNEELLRGTYDFALVQPFDYVEAHEKQGYIPLMRREKDLEAIMVVKKDAPYKNINELKGNVIALAPYGSAVTKLLTFDLEEKGFHLQEEFTLSYSKNHFICLQKVLDGDAAACVTAKRARDIFIRENGEDNFRTLYTTEPIAHILFVVHPRVNKHDREAFMKAIVWRNDAYFSISKESFVEAKDSDYDYVRMLEN